MLGVWDSPTVKRKCLTCVIWIGTVLGQRKMTSNEFARTQERKKMWIGRVKLEKWGESSLNWVLQLCSNSYIALIRQPWVFPSSWVHIHQLHVYGSNWFLLWFSSQQPTISVHSLTHVGWHPARTLIGSHLRPSPRWLVGVISTLHVTSTMSFRPLNIDMWLTHVYTHRKIWKWHVMVC